MLWFDYVTDCANDDYVTIGDILKFISGSSKIPATGFDNIPKIGLSLICSEIYLLFLPELPKTFTHYSFFIPIVPPVIPFLFCCVSDNITMDE